MRLLLLLLLLLLLFFALGTSFRKALEILKAEINHELCLGYMSHFHINIAEWIGEAGSIKPLNRNRKILEKEKCLSWIIISSIDEMQWHRAEMKSAPTW